MRRVCLLLISLALSIPLAQAAGDTRLWLSEESWLDGNNPQTVRRLRIGISVFAQPNLNDPIILQTVRTLRKAFPDTAVTVDQLWQQDLLEAIRAEKFDLVLSSAAFFFRARELGLKDLATVVHRKTPDPNSSEGAVIAVRSDREDLRTLDDLEGKILAVNLPRGLFNYDVAMGEVATGGWNWEQFFSREIRTDDYFKAAELVKSGKADVVFFKTCFLEQTGLINTGDFKVISEKTNGVIGCKTSTELYPNWTMAITASAPQTYASRIVQTLLSMPPVEPDGLHWDTATNFSSIDRLFRTLKVWHYDYLRDEWSLKRFLEAYRAYILAGLILFIALCGYSRLLKRMVEKRTAELSKALQEQRISERNAKAAMERLDALRRAGVAGQLSSIFVHEVRQPLEAILCYARGTHRLAERETLDRELLVRSVEKIEASAERIDSIVERVRSYAKRTTRRPVQVNLTALVDAVVEDFRSTGRVPQRLVTSLESNVKVLADPFEMQVLVHNLIRNASDAMKGDTEAPIEIALISSRSENICRLSVRDRGPQLSEAQVKAMSVPLSSTKNKGLGLGLAIIRSILEVYRGDLRFYSRPDGGLDAQVTLPLAADKAKDTP